MNKCAYCKWDKLTFNPTKQQKTIGYRHYYAMDSYYGKILCDICYEKYAAEISIIQDKYYERTN